MPFRTERKPANASPSSEKEVMVELRDIHLAFGKKVILDGVNLKLHKDEVVALLGPSGSGKSTMIKIITGLLEPTDGEVVVNSDRIGLAFQNAALFTSMTVAENIEMVLERTTDLEDEEIDRRVAESLEVVGLAEDWEKLPGELSGGMQKRVGIARALAIRPDIMLYDEPSAGLDPILAHKLEKDLREINEERKMATLVVTHELPSVDTLADRVVLLYEGKIVFEGTKDEFFSTDNPHAKQFRDRQEGGPIEV